MLFRKLNIIAFFLLSCVCMNAAKFVELDSPNTEAGYLAYLLINENPFPSERSYESVEDSKRGMVQVLWVINNRLHEIPAGYTQFQVANTKAKSVIGIITAEGQCEGFYKGKDGNPAFADRVQKRIEYLLKIANSGNKPGKFSELLSYARDLSRNYMNYLRINDIDVFKEVYVINKIKVTGRGYSWMTNRDYYNPGGDYVSIPNTFNGAIGGNRFFTLKKRK